MLRSVEPGKAGDEETPKSTETQNARAAHAAVRSQQRPGAVS